jgi:RNA polymerase sigma-70 factor (ECF subfamily)
MDRRFAHLTHCLDALPSRQRSIVEDYYYRRNSVERMAAATGTTIEAIYKSLQRIRQALLDCVTTSMRREEAQA